MKIYEYEDKKVIEFKGLSENLETLENSISKLICVDSSYNIATDLLAPSKSYNKMTLDEYEKYLLDGFGIKNEIRANEISLTRKERFVLLEISTKEQVNKLISRICQKFNVIATIIVDGFNDDDEPFEELTEVTDCYCDGTYESTVMQWEEYIYRYGPKSSWENYLNDLINNLTIDEFKDYHRFLNDQEIKDIEKLFGPFKS